MRIPKPHHSTVVAYVALLVALGGSAYAVSKVDSRSIENRSIKGKDVADDALGGRQIDEGKLAPGPGAGQNIGVPCDPAIGAPVDCVVQRIVLRTDSALLLIAAGSKSGRNGSGSCGVTVDGSALGAGPSLAGPYPDGFAITQVTGTLSKGAHTAGLQCNEDGGDLLINSPGISIIAVNRAN